MADQRSKEERDHDWSLELQSIDKRSHKPLTKPAMERAPKIYYKETRLRKGGYDFEPKFEDNETPYGLTTTVPDQSMSLEALLQRHINGIVIPNAKNPIWEDDMDHDHADLSKLNDLDIHDKELIRDQTKQSIDEHSSKLKKHKADQKAAAKKKEEGQRTTDDKSAAPKTDGSAL